MGKQVLLSQWQFAVCLFDVSLLCPRKFDHAAINTINTFAMCCEIRHMGLEMVCVDSLPETVGVHWRWKDLKLSNGKLCSGALLAAASPVVNTRV